MLGFIAIGIGGVSLLLNIVGLAIPNWLYKSVGDNTIKLGLWRGCFPTGLGTVCDSYTTDAISDSLKGVRALELLGMLLLIAALVCAALKLFVLKTQAMLPKVAGACAVVAGAFMIIGCVVYAVKTKDELTKGLPFSLDLHAGFALCIVAGIGSIVAAVLFFMIKDDN